MGNSEAKFIAAVRTCNHCGRDNADAASHCSGCGTALVPEAQPESRAPKRKSKPVAVILALFFGPLGLLYLGMEGVTAVIAVAVILVLIFGPVGLWFLGVEEVMAVIFVAGVGYFAPPLFLIKASFYYHPNGIGGLVSLLARALCVWWALKVVTRQNSASSVSDQNSESGVSDTAAGAADALLEADALLKQAVKLEDVDMAQAISKYEELIAKYPGCRASTSARICLATIKSHQKGT